LFSPDLAAVDFFLFPMLNFTLDGRRWNIQLSSLVELCAIPQKTFQQCFQIYQQRWMWCIGNGGDKAN